MGAQRYRFTRQQRLLRPDEFTIVMKEGRRSRDPLFSVFARVNGLAHGRLGLAVSRKVAPAAVQRNRLRRQIRESFRGHQHALGGLDLVVMPHAPATRTEAGALRTSLEQHWQKTATLCKPSSCV